MFATLGYRFDRGPVVGGCRRLAVDHEKADFRMGVALSGPMLCLAFTF